MLFLVRTSPVVPHIGSQHCVNTGHSQQMIGGEGKVGNKSIQNCGSLSYEHNSRYHLNQGSYEYLQQTLNVGPFDVPS